MKICAFSVFLLAAALASVGAFSVAPRLDVSTVSTTTTLAAKGFGTPKQTNRKSEGQIKREQESSNYDEIAASGGQEYR